MMKIRQQTIIRAICFSCIFHCEIIPSDGSQCDVTLNRNLVSADILFVLNLRGGVILNQDPSIKDDVKKIRKDKNERR